MPKDTFCMLYEKHISFGLNMASIGKNNFLKYSLYIVDFNSHYSIFFQIAYLLDVSLLKSLADRYNKDRYIFLFITDAGSVLLAKHYRSKSIIKYVRLLKVLLEIYEL